MKTPEQPFNSRIALRLDLDGDCHLAGIKADEDSFRQGAKGVSCRSGSVNGTRRVDSQMAVPVIHKSAFPDLIAFHHPTVHAKIQSSYDLALSVAILLEDCLGSPCPPKLVGVSSTRTCANRALCRLGRTEWGLANIPGEILLTRVSVWLDADPCPWPRERHASMETTANPVLETPQSPLGFPQTETARTHSC